MLKFTANLNLLFTELELIDRFKAAKNAGFNAVEIQFPYSLSAKEIKKELEKNQLKLILFNVDADDLLHAGEGLACVPEKKNLFLHALQQSLCYAEILQPEAINILPGCCKDPDRTTEYLSTFKNNLALAINALSPLGIKTVFEAINTIDMPGFVIHSGQQMLKIIKQINHPMLLMQYDIYHMQMMNEDVNSFINQYADKIGHIQFADVPGRGQPGSGLVNFNQLFTSIKQSKYTGWVGAEYNPVGNTTQSLKWFTK